MFFSSNVLFLSFDVGLAIGIGNILESLSLGASGFRFPSQRCPIYRTYPRCSFRILTDFSRSLLNCSHQFIFLFRADTKTHLLRKIYGVEPFTY